MKYAFLHTLREATGCLFLPVTRRQTSDNEDVFNADWFGIGGGGIFRHLVNEFDHTTGFARLCIADDHLNDNTPVVESMIDTGSDAGLVFV